MAHGLW
jgi:hypothetical protein